MAAAAGGAAQDAHRSATAITFTEAERRNEAAFAVRFTVHGTGDTASFDVGACPYARVRCLALRSAAG